VTKNPERGPWNNRLDVNPHASATRHARAKDLIVEIDIDDLRNSGFKRFHGGMRDGRLCAPAAGPPEDHGAFSIEDGFGAEPSRSRAPRFNYDAEHKGLSCRYQFCGYCQNVCSGEVSGSIGHCHRCAPWHRRMMAVQSNRRRSDTAFNNRSQTNLCSLFRSRQMNLIGLL
jgi:hypothetical protein